MPSVIEICNLSLARIGQGSINDLDEASPQAEECNKFYANARDSLLRQFPWNFSSSNKILALSTLTIPGWAYTYTHPTNTLCIRNVYVSGMTNPEIPNEYEVISEDNVRYICTDLYQAYAKCTMQITDSTLFDALFVEALSYKLALDLIPPLTHSTSRAQEIERKYSIALSNATLAGAIEGAPKLPSSQRPKTSNSYIKSRW